MRHRREAMHVKGRAEVLHRGHGAAVAEHAEVQLRARLVVGDGELEKGDASEERVPLRGGEHSGHVILLASGMDAVVLADVHRRRRERPVVLREEHHLQVGSGVCGVEAVHPPRLVGLEDVVSRRVAIGLRPVHGVVQHRHLRERGHVPEAIARHAHREGEGRGEVDEGPRHIRVLLRVEHRVEGADERARHEHGALPAADGGGRRHLQVGLIQDVHDAERPMVRVVLGQEAVGEVLHVQRLHLREAVVVRGLATPRRLLVVRPVAHAWRHLQAQGVGLLKELLVAVPGVVAVQSHEVRPHVLHHRQVSPPR
mmetsp:Transcript_103564/g.299585  ORF Transcript_103564/g.299585 Transcript_103564/m.299585 type:complete len:312 (+) Transcript_103564:850-1785(+)